MASPPPTDVALPKRGDRDATGETRVRDVQTRLDQLALMDTPVNGLFDAAMATALRRFQWYVVNRPWRLLIGPGGTPSTALIEAYTPVTLGITGAYDQATADVLQAWVDRGYRPTTALVRLDLTRLGSCVRAATYTQLSYPGVTATEVLVSEAFVAGVETLNKAAADNKVTVRVNQTFRIAGIAPRGAVVPPATKSQHLVGRALDGNFVDGKSVATAALMNAHKESKPVDDFIAAAKTAGLRWGGDFRRKDPIHFDDPLASESEDYTMHFFFCQRSYRDQHAMRTA